MFNLGLQPIKRSIIAVVIGLVVVLIVIFLMPKYSISPQGIILPVGEIYPKTPDKQVVIYNDWNSPLNYKSIGWINITYHTIQNNANDQSIVTRYAQKMASRVGGDGIIVNVSGHTVASTPKAMQALILQGMVIKLDENI